MKKILNIVLAVMLLLMIPFSVLAADKGENEGKYFFYECDNEYGIKSENFEEIAGYAQRIGEMYKVNIAFEVFYDEDITELGEYTQVYSALYETVKGYPEHFIYYAYEAANGNIYIKAGNGAETIFNKTLLTTILDLLIKEVKETGEIDSMYTRLIDLIETEYWGADLPTFDPSYAPTYAPTYNPVYNPSDPIEEDLLPILIDDAKLLSETEYEDIYNELKMLHDTYGGYYVILTENSSLDGKTAMEYADDYFDYNGYGENGCILYINMQTRDYWISTKGECIDVLEDRDISYMCDDIVYCLKNENYYGCFSEYISSLSYELKDYKENYIEKIPTGSATEFIIDNCGVLTSDQIKTLNDVAFNFRKLYGKDILIYIDNQQINLSNYFYYYGYTSYGLAINIVPAEKETYISVINYSEAISDDEALTIAGKTNKLVRKGNIYDACITFMKYADLEMSAFEKTSTKVFSHTLFDSILYRVAVWWNGISIMAVVIAMLIALAISFGTTASMKSKLNSAKPKASAHDYIVPGTFNVYNSSDMFLYSNTSRVYSPRSESSSSGGSSHSSGGSSVHTSSSGSSHGGGGGKF